MPKLDFSKFLSCRHFLLVIVRRLAAVRVKVLGAVTESFHVGRLKPGLSLALELAFGTNRCTSASTPGGGAGQPRRTCLPSCSRYPRDRRSSMNVS